MSNRIRNKSMNLVIFEDDKFADFEPLSLAHPAYMLLCGTSKMYSKWVKAVLPKTVSFLCRPYLAGILELETGIEVNTLPKGDSVFVNGRVLATKDISAAIQELLPGEALICDNTVCAFRPNPKSRSKNTELILNLHRESAIALLRTSLREKKIKARVVSFLWEVIEKNGEMIEAEFSRFGKKSESSGKIDIKAGIINKRLVRVFPGARIGPQVVIDASEGPVLIDKGAVIEPLTFIKGPCYIGPDCRIVSGRIREGCSFGPVCRVGGEIEESVLLGYCNKYHDGFVGHAYLGEWVNLGAMTTNSDLKNNYATISVYAGGQARDTGRNKVGSFIGDHTKTGIGTLLNTGICIGFSCNLYGGGLFAEKSIKSFTWGTPGNLVQYKQEKAAKTAASSMQRRGIEFTQMHSRLFEDISRMAGWT